MISDYKYECNFCGMKFKLEDRFMNHLCKAMKRDAEIKTPLGQAAYSFYEKWMKLQRRNVPKLETFLTSKYYNTFIKFATFSKKVGLPDTDSFIAYMIKTDMPPTIWPNDQVYSSYINHLDRNADPTKQARQTIDYLFKVADSLDVDVSEVFEHLDGNDVIQMLHRRQLSPWILINSPKFKQFLIHNVTDDQRITMTTIIQPEIWAKKKANHPEIIAQMKKYVRELNL